MVNLKQSSTAPEKVLLLHNKALLVQVGHDTDA